MQEDKKDRRELIKEAEKLINELKREEAKITPDSSVEEFLDAVFKFKDIAQHNS